MSAIETLDELILKKRCNSPEGTISVLPVDSDLFDAALRELSDWIVVKYDAPDNLNLPARKYFYYNGVDVFAKDPQPAQIEPE